MKPAPECDCDICAWRDGAIVLFAVNPEPEDAAEIVDRLLRPQGPGRAL